MATMSLIILRTYASHLTGAFWQLFLANSWCLLHEASYPGVKSAIASSSTSVASGVARVKMLRTDARSAESFGGGT